MPLAASSPFLARMPTITFKQMLKRMQSYAQLPITSKNSIMATGIIQTVPNHHPASFIPANTSNLHLSLPSSSIPQHPSIDTAPTLPFIYAAASLRNVISLNPLSPFSFPDVLGLVATPLVPQLNSLVTFLRVVLGSMSKTGWESLAPQAATTEWQGEGTYMALVD
jgi:hypothetical protein